MRAGLLKLSGMLDVKYNAEQDFFSVRFESVMVSLEKILATVCATGKQMGRDYFPEVVP